ncbi:MAG TPA: DUF401 family protein [Candidatus Acidoferrum sp.]|nr:DUF401 family protein [Candidatus Acidoferrum sp.]
MDLIRLFLVLIAILIALKKNLPVGITLFAAGLLTALLYHISVGQLAAGYWSLLKSERFMTLTGVIVLITILGQLLKELGFLERLSEACRHLYGGNRTAVAVLPFLIGLMPMPGGALLSAPLVGNVLKEKQYSPEFKTTANYWFRHIVECFWPVYPGIILIEGITGMPMWKVSLLQLPFSLFMLIMGIIFFSRKIDKSGDGDVRLWHSFLDIVRTLWPIAGAITIYAAFGVPLALSILIALVVLTATARPRWQCLSTSLKQGLSIKLIFLVFGILSFQTVLEMSGAIDSFPKLASIYHLPPQVLIFAACFTLGLLTGMVAAYIGMGFTLLAGFIYQPVLVPSNILIGYLSGYLGMLLSPTHLCLILTNDHFGSDLTKVYKMMALPLILVSLLGFLLSVTPWAGIV